MSDKNPVVLSFGGQLACFDLEKMSLTIANPSQRVSHAAGISYLPAESVNIYGKENLIKFSNFILEMVSQIQAESDIQIHEVGGAEQGNTL